MRVGISTTCYRKMHEDRIDSVVWDSQHCLVRIYAAGTSWRCSRRGGACKEGPVDGPADDGEDRDSKVTPCPLF